MPLTVDADQDEIRETIALSRAREVLVDVLLCTAEVDEQIKVPDLDIKSLHALKKQLLEAVTQMTDLFPSLDAFLARTETRSSRGTAFIGQFAAARKLVETVTRRLLEKIAARSES